MQLLLKIYLSLSKHILLMHLACPFELLGRVHSLKEELAGHSLKRTIGKQDIQ